MFFSFADFTLVLFSGWFAFIIVIIYFIIIRFLFVKLLLILIFIGVIIMLKRIFLPLSSHKNIIFRILTVMVFFALMSLHSTHYLTSQIIVQLIAYNI